MLLLLGKLPQTFGLGTLLLFLALMNPPLVDANPITPLTEPEIQQKLLNLPGWSRQNQQLQRTFTLKNFVEAIAFVEQLVAPSERLGHHPDILILYNRVTITLSTHDAAGLTPKDFELAGIITQIAESRTGNQK